LHTLSGPADSAAQPLHCRIALVFDRRAGAFGRGHGRNLLRSILGERHAAGQDDGDADGATCRSY